jgi:hypothetical protein
MSDNHDPNDLSWLDDPNGHGDGDSDSLFGGEQPDWELPPLDIDTPLGRRLSGDDDEFASLFGDGLNVETSNDPAVASNEIPSWLQASAPSGATQDVPAVDDLMAFGQPAITDSEGIPSWLDTQEMAAAPIANKEDVAPWLAEADETSERAMAEADAQSKSQPDVAPGDEASFLPPWLQDADDLGAADANAFEASFDDLDFAVDQQAEMGGMNDPFGGMSETSGASDVFGGDMPEWMQTREQVPVPQGDISVFLSDMPTIPGETTDPLLANLLQSGGASGGTDFDLLSLLERTDSGETIKTGMLVPPDERSVPPSSGNTDALPDFATLMSQPEPTPDYYPLLDDPISQTDHPFDFSTLTSNVATAVPEPALDDFSDFERPSFDESSSPAPSASDDFDFSSFETLPPVMPAVVDDFDFSSLEDLPSDASETGLPAFVAPPVKPPIKPSRPVDDDFDSFLTSLRGDELAIDSSSSSDSESLDLSALLRDPGFGDLRDTPQSSTSDNAPVIPEFLRDVRVREASVAARLRQQQDIPLEDLPDELRALHDELAAIPQSPMPSGTGLPILPSVLPTSAQPRIPTGLNESQRRGAELLRSLAGGGGVDVDAAADVAMQVTQKRIKRRRFSINATRLLLAAGLTVSVILPFVSDADILKVGIQPPAVFAPVSAGGQVYNFIETLVPGSMVLVSADYSPGGIAELDELTIPILRHLFVRGVKPIIIGSDPVTLQHVGRLADDIAQGGQRNVDYVVGRYLLGEAIGTQDFVQNIGSVLETDINGQSTGLSIRDFNAFSGVIILTDRADSVRVWSEQVAPRMTVPLTFAVGAGAAPMSAPYIKSGRFLVGLRDGITYTRQLNEQYPLDTFVLPTQPPPTRIAPTALPTEAPVIVETESSTTEATEVVSPTFEPTTLESTSTAEFTVSPSTTPNTQVTSTRPPTLTVQPTQTPTLEPTATSDGGSAESTPGPTLSFEIFAVITGTDRVNVRQGPGTNFQILTSVALGERFRVISGSSDGQWLQIELTDARTGWVSALRAQIQQNESGLPGMRVGAGGLYQAQSFTVETSPERRWYAISLGAVVAAVLMALGSFIGVIQIILRRRR